MIEHAKHEPPGRVTINATQPGYSPGSPERC